MIDDVEIPPAQLRAANAELEARVRETEADVREIFLDLLQRRPRA